MCTLAVPSSSRPYKGCRGSSGGGTSSHLFVMVVVLVTHEAHLAISHT